MRIPDKNNFCIISGFLVQIHQGLLKVLSIRRKYTTYIADMIDALSSILIKWNKATQNNIFKSQFCGTRRKKNDVGAIIDCFISLRLNRIQICTTTGLIFIYRTKIISSKTPPAVMAGITVVIIVRTCTISCGFVCSLFQHVGKIK